MSAFHLDHIRALSSRDAREQNDQFFVEGERFVITALTTRAVVECVVLSRKRRLAPTLEKLLSRYRGPILDVATNELAAISSAKEPSGIGAIVRRTYQRLPEKSKRGPWLCFDEVRSRGNLGSVIRTAAAFDAGGVIFLGDIVDPFDPVVVRATMGAIFMLPIVRTDEAGFDRWRRRVGAHVVGTSARAHRDLRRVKLRRPSVLMIGCERGGMSDRQRALSAEVARIPISGRVDSLNLAIAASVMLYETWWRSR